MTEKIKNQPMNWPENGFVQLAQTLDSFLSAAVMPQTFLFMGSSSKDSSSREFVEVFAGKITGKNFPNADTLIFDAAGDSGVDGIREILSLASLMPVMSNRKVLIMLNMQKASTQMLNALLKTLEEPPEHANFLLLSSTPLLATIMSRCQVFSLHHGENINFPASEVSADLSEALQVLISNRTAGQAERMVLINSLATLEDELLPKVLESWLRLQVSELKTNPQNFTAVRATTEAIQSLKQNFNKKMVLRQFVTTGLI